MSAILSTAYRQACPKAAAQADRYDEADKIADEALKRRRADRITPPPVASRADKIVAEADAKRVAYRNAHPGADQAMVYGAQIGHLVAMVRELCNEHGFAEVRDADLDYLEVHASIGNVLVGYEYRPDDEFYSAPQVDVHEVWLNGAGILEWVPAGELDRIADEVLERHEAALRRDAESGACRAED